MAGNEELSSATLKVLKFQYQAINCRNMRLVRGFDHRQHVYGIEVKCNNPQCSSMHTLNLSLESTTTRIKNNESFCVNCWKECDQCGNPFWVIMSPTAAEPRMLEITVDDENEDDEIILWTVDVMTFRSSGCFIYRWVGWEQKQWSLTTTAALHNFQLHPPPNSSEIGFQYLSSYGDDDELPSFSVRSTIAFFEDIDVDSSTF